MNARIPICLFSLFVSICSFGQGVPIKASVTKSKILIGEPFQLVLEYESVSGTRPRIAVPDSIPHFEFSAPARSDSFESGNIVRYTDTFFLTSFDSGRWMIPAFQLSPQIKTTEIPVDVVFSEFDPSQDYHSIKDIVETDLHEDKFQWWWWAIGLVVALALLYYLFQRRKRPKSFSFQSASNPYDDAMQELRQLKNEKPAVKVYYSKLIEIFRVYVFKRKGILSLQKTTDDLLEQLRGVDINKDQFHSLLQALRLSDFVKFAKYQPDEKDQENVFQAIKNSIEELEQSERKSIPITRTK